MKASEIRKIVLDDIKNNIIATLLKKDDLLYYDVIKILVDNSTISTTDENKLILFNIDLVKIIDFLKRNEEITLKSPKELVDKDEEWAYSDIPDPSKDNKTHDSRIKPFFIHVGDMLYHIKVLKKVNLETSKSSHDNVWTVHDRRNVDYIYDTRTDELVNKFFSMLSDKEYNHIRKMILRKKDSLYAKGMTKRRRNKPLTKRRKIKPLTKRRKIKQKINI